VSMTKVVYYKIVSYNKMHSRNSRSKFHRIRTSNHREYQHYQAQTNNQIQMYQITSLNYYHLKEVE